MRSANGSTRLCARRRIAGCALLAATAALPIAALAGPVLITPVPENDALHFDTTFPAGTGTELTLSPELLLPDTTYAFEVPAIEAGGNQSITEGCFTTAH